MTKFAKGNKRGLLLKKRGPGTITGWFPKTRRNRWLLFAGLFVTGAAIVRHRFAARKASDDSEIDDSSVAEIADDSVDSFEDKESWHENILSWFSQTRRSYWVLPAVLFVASGTIWQIWHYLAIRESTDDARVHGQVIQVSSKIEGLVVSVNFEDNQYVEAGAILVQLDSTDYEAALAGARRALEEAEENARAARRGILIEPENSSGDAPAAESSLQERQADVEAARTRLESAEASLAAAKARRQQAEAEYVRAGQKEARFKELIENDAVSRQEYETAVAATAMALAVRNSADAAVKEAEKSVETAKEGLAEAENAASKARAGLQAVRTARRIAISRSEVQAADAKVRQARKAVEQAELRVHYTSIVAEASGFIRNKTVRLGQAIEPDETLLAIVPLEGFWVVANYEETRLDNIRPGQRASIFVASLGKKLSGHVESIRGVVHATSSSLAGRKAAQGSAEGEQKIQVRIVFDRGQDAERRLRSGMPVKATIITE